MKKFLPGIIALVLMLNLCVGGVLAFDRSNQACDLYTDADNNGICDTCRDENCPGQRDCFTDVDSNGICDSRMNVGCGQGHHAGGCGNQVRSHHGHGRHC